MLSIKNSYWNILVPQQPNRSQTTYGLFLFHFTSLSFLLCFKKYKKNKNVIDFVVYFFYGELNEYSHNEYWRMMMIKMLIFIYFCLHICFWSSQKKNKREKKVCIWVSQRWSMACKCMDILYVDNSSKCLHTHNEMKWSGFTLIGCLGTKKKRGKKTKGNRVKEKDGTRAFYQHSTSFFFTMNFMYIFLLV